ncbi:hypothetical protein MRB53_011283 [Persea americana]|uniref:Uncharacterized protein n=1 Tax=Persea americana TaxID=3435 RepID=A0ACC2LU44_PERAE|nr:hypothetical protein MRB53_011283 [Persea americana]
MAKKTERDTNTNTIPLSRFGVLVAQLESIVASARQQSPDALLCFDLLSDLVSLIEEEPKESILYSQRKCEDALFSLLILGARRPVRRLASVAMGRVIFKGDGISIYSRASSLQGWLSDGKRSEPLSCAGAAQCLGELYRLFGRRITSGLTETTSIAAKLMKFHEDFVRQEALQMLQNALDGSGGIGASGAYSEAFRIVMRLGVGDKSFIVRIAAARCLKTFATIGGPGLGVVELESSATYCVKALEDPVSSVRDAFAEALGAILALGMNPEAQVQPRGKSNPIAGKKLEGGLHKHLILPFMKASGAHLKELRVGLALSWVFFLQAMRLKYLLPDSELQNFSLRAIEMLLGNSVDAHALACVLYILRVGATNQMTEPTQRSFLVLLARQLESPDSNPAMRVAALRTLSYLLATLGEVPPEFKEVLDNTVVVALSHSSLIVRTEAALMLRSLVEFDPTCVGGLISYAVTTLHALRENVAMEKGNYLKVELDSLNGQALVLGALVSISPRLLLGYPAKLPRSVFDVSKKMLTRFSRNPTAATVEKEAGWLLLASLIASMPKEELEDQVFDILSLWAAPFGGIPERQIKQAEDLSSEIRVWSAAVEALTAFIRSFLSPASVAINVGILVQPVLVYLSGALSYILSLSAKQLQTLKPSLDLFIIRTLIAYQSLPDPMAYKIDHPQIINICTTPFRDPSGCDESSCLRLLLDKRDACLGPWIPGRDWFEDELRAFEGGKDGLMPCVWEKELPSFPQPEGTSKMVVNQMLLCFGTIFAMQDSRGKVTLLGMMEQCLKAGKKQSWHAASVTNVCVGLLSGLKALLRLRPLPLEIEILSSAQAIFQGILSEGEICASQRRASSEGLGLLARLGNDIFTARMTRALLGDLVGTSDSIYIGSVAFSLGRIHRSAGGMALSTLVPVTVSSISSLAKSSNASLQSWSLHGLLLAIEAAGLSYVSQVQATLFLAMEILLCEENGWVDLRQGIGRLINAIVAVLGPELSPGSTFFSRCKSGVAEISSGQETSTLLECVRFTQQLVLFAPQAVSVHSHVQTLLPTLYSRQPALRQLAVSTLKHLIEKDPVSIIDEQIEVNLFGMLDEETDSEITNLVRSTIKGLYYASCPSRSSRWIAIFRNIVLATPTTKIDAENRSERDSINGTSNSDDRASYGDDDEDMIAGSRDRQSQTSSSEVFTVHLKRDAHLRYRTRVFAAECLSYITTAVGTDPAHFDLSLARKKLLPSGHVNIGEWLVLHTQDLVALAYQISTSQFENLQSIGVGLLTTVMDKFGNVPDPELPGHLLMEQYQAQLVSAVRTALATFSSPLLLEAGLQLATKILTSSITRGDRIALQRMFSLISRPLNDFKDIYYPSFAEWVTCKIKIRLLEAHASVKCYAYSFLREQQNEIPDEYQSLIPMISESSTILGKYWIGVLSDYSHLCFGLQSKSNYKPFLDGIQSSLVSSEVQPYLDEAWPIILQAVALDALPVKVDVDGSSKLSTEDLSRSNFISGYSMVRLELREFHFVWGFSLFILFQAQQPVVGKQVIPLLGSGKINTSGDSLVKEPRFPGLRLYETALLVFRSLLVENFFVLEFITVDLCRELLQVLLYFDVVVVSCHKHVMHALSQIVQICPDEYFKKEDFAFAAMELCVKCLYGIIQSTDPVSKETQSFRDLISVLFVTAETIARRLNPEKQLKLILAFLSICCMCFKEASTVPWLSAVTALAQNIVPLLKEYFRDKASLHKDDMAHLEIILGAWQNETVLLSQYCIKSIHDLENKKGDSWKVLLIKLAFYLDETVSLARLAHEAQLCGQNKDDYKFFCTIFMHCIKCFQMTLSDSNKQVQIIGLNVMKSAIQRELGQDRSMDNRSFILFYAGELIGDVFFLIQIMLKRPMDKEAVTIASECLRILVLLHTLSQGSESQKAVMNLLLEGIIMILSASTEGHKQELIDVKSDAMRLVSHLAQIPSSAIQFKDILLAMPATRRQQLQDIIRASVAQGPNVVETIRNASSSVIKQPVQIKQEPQENFSVPAVTHPDMDSIEEEDDWDAFQSFPASDAPVCSQVEGTGAFPASIDNSSISESNNDSKIDSPISPHRPVDDLQIDVKDLKNPTDYCPVESLKEFGAAHGEEQRTIGSHSDGNVGESSDLKPPKDAEVLSTERLVHSSGDGLTEREGNGNENQDAYKLQPVEGAEEMSDERYLDSGELSDTEPHEHARIVNDGNDNQEDSDPQSLEHADVMNDEQGQEYVGEKTTKNEVDGSDIQEHFDAQSLENMEKQNNYNPYGV